MFVRSRRLIAAASIVAASALMLSACGSDNGGGDSGSASGSKSIQIDAKKDPAPDIKVDGAAAALVPTQYKSKGELVVGSDTTYPPNEYIDADGKTIVGMDVDMGNAIGKKLGLKVVFQTATFDTLLAALGSKYDIGMSSFTDNAEREKIVDFVTYFDAGTAWVAKKGVKIDIDNMCGKKVSVQTGTTQEVDIDARSKKCTDAGKDAITIQKNGDQGIVTTNVVSGKSDAMLADLPVILDAISKTDGQLVQVGKMYDAAPYGVAVPKSGGTLKEAIQAAIDSMIKDGSYKKILVKWGADVGAIDQAQINAAGA